MLGLAMASPLERGWLVSGNKVATIEFAGVLFLCPFFLHANGSTVYISTETPVVEVFVIVLQWCEKRKDMRKRNVAGNVMQAK